MQWLVVCLAIAGCAVAGPGNRIVGGLIDAGSRQLTLTQTTIEANAPGTSFACTDASGSTRENSYYRVFTLSDHDITTTLHVTQVEFGIETAIAGTGGKQPATVQLGDYGGTPGAATLDLAQVRSIAATDIQIPDGKDTRMAVPITADVAPTAKLIVEIFIPDGLAAGNQFLIGANGRGEDKPGYTRRPMCGVADPTTMQSVAAGLGKGETDLVMAVTGTE